MKVEYQYNWEEKQMKPSKCNVRIIIKNEFNSFLDRHLQDL